MDKDSYKVLLIYPPSNWTFWNWLPEGVSRLTSHLKNKGFNVKQENLDVKCFYHNHVSKSNRSKIDMNVFNDCNRVTNFLMGWTDSYIEENIQKMLNCIEINKTNLIAFSIPFDEQYLTSLCLAKKIKEKSNAKIVFGGRGILWNAFETLQKFNFVDYVIKGEGEASLPILCNMLRKNRIVESRIPGLVYRKKGTVFGNKIKYFNLNKIPIPSYENVNLYIKIKKMGFIGGINIPYQVSRGCDGKCIFCGFENKNIFLRSPEKIVSDLKNISKKYKGYSFFLACNTINIKNEHLSGICEKIKKNELKIKWASFARPRNLTLKLLQLMKEAGCYEIEYGVETGSQKLLNYLKKGLRVEEIENVLKNTKKAGIAVKINLILNIPGETEEDVEETISFIKKNSKNIDKVIIHKFFLALGSAMYKESHKLHKISDDIQNFEKIKELFSILKDKKIHVIAPRIGDRLLMSSGHGIYHEW